METPTAILASYVKLSTLVDGTVRVILDVEPSDRAAAFAMFGDPGTSFGIAPIDPKAALAAGRKAMEAAQPEAVEHPSKRRFYEMRRSAQSAIRCTDPTFHAFLNATLVRELGYDPVASKEDAADLVRHLCQVNSRSEIDGNGAAERAWDRIESDYWIWQRDPRRAA